MAFSPETYGAVQSLIEQSMDDVEAINNVLQDAFTPRDSSSTVGDANLCLKNGIYRTDSGSANVQYNNGFLLVFAIDPNMVIQINTMYTPEYTAIRSNWWGTWSGWRKIPTEAIS